MLNNLEGREYIKVFDAEGNEVTDYSKPVGTNYGFRIVDGFSALDAGVVYIRGDVNSDGFVNADDMRLIMKAMIMPMGNSLTGVKLLVADVDGDGVISIEDLALISMHITGDKALAPITLN